MNFLWEGKKDDAPVSPPTSGNSDNPPPNTGSPATAAIDSARANAEEQLNLSPRKRRARRDSTGIQNDSDALRAEVNAVVARQLDALHDPKAWGALLGAPADVAVALTGRDYWQLTEKERDTLGASGSAAARVMMITNPRSLAFAMLGAAITMVYLPRVIKEARHQRKEQQEQKKKTPEPT